MKNCVYLFLIFLSISVSAQRKFRNLSSPSSAEVSFAGQRHHKYATKFQSTFSFALLFKRQPQCESPTDHLCGEAFCCPDADSCVRRAPPHYSLEKKMWAQWFLVSDRLLPLRICWNMLPRLHRRLLQQRRELRQLTGQMLSQGCPNLRGRLLLASWLHMLQWWGIRLWQ